MKSKDKENHKFQNIKRIILSCLIIFILFRTIQDQINLKLRIQDSKEERSKISINYYDISNDNEEKLFRSYDTITDNLLRFSISNSPIINLASINNLNFFSSQSSLDISSCLGCGTEFQNPSADSTEKDLILCYVNGLVSFSFRVINSLRSCKCMATIVLFVDQITADLISQSEMENFQKCGVFIINVGSIPRDVSNPTTHIYHIYFHEFLKLYRKSFNRVIILDPTRVIIQSDPFSTHFHKNIVGITALPYDIINENNEDVDSMFDEKIQKQGFVLQSTPIYGSIDGIIAFYSIIFQDKHFSNIMNSVDNFDTSFTIDSLINSYYNEKVFEKNGITLLIAAPGNFICSVVDINSLFKVQNYYDTSDVIKPGMPYFTSRYLREKFVMYSYRYSKNPPSIISFFQTTQTIEHLFSCPNRRIGQYKRAMPRNITMHPHNKQRNRTKLTNRIPLHTHKLK